MPRQDKRRMHRGQGRVSPWRCSCTTRARATWSESREGHARFSPTSEIRYTSPGKYFVTVCTRRMECLFGSIGGDGQVTLTQHGQIVRACWDAIPEHFPGVTLDTSVTMPNHLHGIFIVHDVTSEGDACVAPTNVSVDKRTHRRSIGSIVGSLSRQLRGRSTRRV